MEMIISSLILKFAKTKLNMHTKHVLQKVITEQQNFVNLHIKDELKYQPEELINSVINSRQLRYTCAGIKNLPGWNGSLLGFGAFQEVWRFKFTYSVFALWLYTVDIEFCCCLHHYAIQLHNMTKGDNNAFCFSCGGAFFARWEPKLLISKHLINFFVYTQWH